MKHCHLMQGEDKLAIASLKSAKSTTVPEYHHRSARMPRSYFRAPEEVSFQCRWLPPEPLYSGSRRRLSSERICASCRREYTPERGKKQSAWRRDTRILPNSPKHIVESNTDAAKACTVDHQRKVRCSSCELSTSVYRAVTAHVVLAGDMESF